MKIIGRTESNWIGEFSELEIKRGFKTTSISEILGISEDINRRDELRVGDEIDLGQMYNFFVDIKQAIDSLDSLTKGMETITRAIAYLERYREEILQIKKEASCEKDA